MHVEGASASHVGQVRESNQDRALVSGSLGAVADGMGGHLGGEHAAALAIAELSGVRGVISESRLIDVVKAANLRIFEGASTPEYRGMGTTIVAAAFDSETAVLTFVNVGDSRGYLFRDNELKQITVDHSLVEDLLRQGRLTEEEARVHPQRNIVTRALGIGPDVDVDAFAVRMEAGDRVILASDGLFNEVEADQITEILDRNPEPESAVEQLVETAVANGGRDNVTVVLLDVLSDDEDAEPVSAHEAEDGNADDGAPTEAEVSLDPSDDAPVHVTPRPSRKKRRFGFRSLMFAIGVLGVVILAFGGTAFYARSGYYADELDGDVVIMRGRPGGVLWFRPSVEELSGLQLEELDEAALERLNRRTVWPSLEEAQVFVDNLHEDSSPEVSASNEG